MSGFIKNLFSGILSFFIGLLRGKKSQENQPSTTPSAQKLTEATNSSAQKLAEATAKTSSGVQSSLTELVGGKKSQENKPSTTTTSKKGKRSGYFMELDESEEMQPVNGKKPDLVAASKTPEPVAAAKPAKEEPAKTPQPVAAQAAKVELVQTAEGIKAQPALPASSSAGASANGQSQTETTFAPKYLAPTPSTNSRRRPGPNMNPFLDMARQVKTPG